MILVYALNLPQKVMEVAVKPFALSLCLLQFFLRLPVDQVTSKMPSLRERC